MRTVEPMTETERILRLSENLLGQLARGKEWATPGVQAALQRAVAGLDSGIETASPRLQASLRRLAEELAGGVETITPHVQERLRRVGPNASDRVTDSVQVKTGRPASRVWWWILGLGALVAGAAAWRSTQASKEGTAPPIKAHETRGTDPDADPDLAAARI